jgi:hypothetical protein
MIGLRAAVWVLTLGVRLLAHDIGRRLLVALVVIVVCAGLVVGMFTYPEPVEPEPAPAHPPTGARAARPRAASEPTTPRPAARPARPAGSPEQAAAAWYAQHKRLPRTRVRVLQHDQVNAKAIRILVLGDGGNGRLDTAVVTVRRDADGWRVHQ